ncbi:flagellin [Thauera sp. 63]|uniref:flagellin n=1 Tax=Thauera sp. 63 TaxID=497321 RepID=UPI003FCCC41D
MPAQSITAKNQDGDIGTAAIAGTEPDLATIAAKIGGGSATVTYQSTKATLDLTGLTVATGGGNVAATSDLTFTLNTKSIDVKFVDGAGTKAEQVAAAINTAGVTGLKVGIDGEKLTLTVDGGTADSSISIDSFLLADAATGSVNFEGKTISASGDDAAVKTAAFSVNVDPASFTGLSAGDTIVSVQSSISNADGGLFAGAAFANAALAFGNANNVNGNNVGEQTLTINGQVTKAVDVKENASAEDIAAAVNAVANETGVEATAFNSATLSGLSQDGVVSFKLNGADISANLSTKDYSNLADAINSKSGATGITAKLSVDKTALTLTNETGANIEISDFGSSVAKDTNPVSMRVAGATGAAALLTDTGDTATDQDSTVIGGTVEFKSPGGYFSVSSSVGQEDGGLFAGNADELKAGENQAVKSIDISTVEGATKALDIVDGALAKVNSIRADLGAVQNRFESTIANLNTSTENLSAARSRIRDTDFASETANLTRSQILQQAGTAMLAQANALPNQVLSLLG